MVEILAPLPARPPTPPRPGSRIDQDRPESPVAVQTPGDSPPLSDPFRAPPSSRGSKRVTFSPWLQTTIQSPRPSKKSKESKWKESPNARSPHLVDNRPFKSILKETSSPIPVWSPNVDTFTTESLAMLLESVIQQLAGESITSRLDAYMQFFGALRTYDGLPAGKDIAEKLSLITDFIQRDVSRDLVNGAPLDTNLANQALKLSAAFVWHADISTQLSDEFKVFLVEHAITYLQEAKVPKSVLTHYMSILSTQNFGPRVMTNARVTRILTVLQDVSKHVSGKAIALHRLSIYQRLLSQAKSTFLSQSTLWVEHLIFGLLHHMKDTRSKAISLGFQISVAAGPTPSLSKNIRELFNRPLENDRKLVTEIRERMSRMVGSVDSGIHVPQIWSIIILLLRSKKWGLDQWEHFKEWVLVLQKCFNCSEPAIKAQAIVGWNRFVYAVSPNESTGHSLVKMLGKPVLSQFERKKSDKSGSPPTQLALTSYYNLLYYAFRPSPPYQYLDLIWEEYVAVPSSHTFSSATALSDSVSRVLANLLWTQQAKVWAETRINDTSKIEVEELPSLDPRWVRSRISSVLKVFESLFKSSIWDDEALEKSNVALAWNCLASALSLASSKEITPSGESMQAVASVLGLLHRLWAAGPSSLNAYGEGCADNFFERFRFLSTTIIISLGGIPFTEKLLLRTTNETLQTANTPTHRHSSPGTNLESPILHLLRTISITSVITAPTPSYVRLVNETIDSSCRGRISRGSRLELLQQSADLTTAETTFLPRPHLLAETVWKASARAASDALQSFPIESARERDGTVSRDYENITKILARGLHFSSAFDEWSQLLESFVRVVRTEKGDRVLATLIVEPVADILMSLTVRDTFLPTTSLLGHSLSIPFLRHTELGIENTVTQPGNSPAFPHKLLESVGRTLHLAHVSFNAAESHGLCNFLESLTSFLGSGVPSFRSQVLENLQIPLGLWVKDEDCKVAVTRGVDSRLLTACRALSSAVLNILQISVADELSSLQKFESIICAGLESPHTSRTKRFVDFWYSTGSVSATLAHETAIGQSASKAASRLSAAASGSQDSAQDATTLSSSAQKKVNQPLNKRRGAYLNSSPVIGVNESPAIETAESSDPQLPMIVQSELTEERINDDISIVHHPSNRREVFRMIESIRSSSPANTPVKLGFDTPVHLRRLHASQGKSELPLTPTLAPAENEEGFIASSPTPATRDPTPAMNSGVPVLNSQDITMADASDLPSSPPELSSRSPSPQKRSKRSRRERRRTAKARKAMRRRSAEEQSSADRLTDLSQMAENTSEAPHVDLTEDPKENKGTPQVDERPPSRRLRSALSQSTDNDQNPAPTAAPGTPAKAADSPSVQNTKSKSGSKKKKRKGSSKSASDESQQPVGQVDAPSTPTVPDYFVDSSSEDVETQIASQLEQDLELALDMGGKEPDEQSLEHRPSSVSTRKRKRDEGDSRPSTASERRRSTRLSSTKDVASIDLDDADATQSQDALAAEASQDTSSAQPLSPTLRRSTRGSQRKEDEPNLTISVPATRVSGSPRRSAGEQETSQPPTKRSRKSLRLEDRSTAATEESSGQAKSTRDTRHRRTRSARNETESQSQPDPQTSAETEANDIELLQDQHDGQDVVLDSIAPQEKPSELNVPLISTEEATDSQMTDMGTSTDPVLMSTDVQMNMDMDAIPHQTPAVVIEQVMNVAIAETEPVPIGANAEPDSSEAGISQSLKKLLGDMKSATLGPSALREVDDLLFNLRVEAHDASRRHKA